MKQGILNIVNVVIDGKRTSIKLSDVQLSIAKELAYFRDMSLNGYLSMLIKTAKSIDKGYGNSMAVRDGIIMELHTILTFKNCKDTERLN